MNITDEETLKGLVDEGLLSEDTAARIKGVQAIDNALRPWHKYCIYLCVSTLLVATGAGVHATEWLPAGVRMFSAVIAWAAGMSCVFATMYVVVGGKLD